MKAQFHHQLLLGLGAKVIERHITLDKLLGEQINQLHFLGGD